MALDNNFLNKDTVWALNDRGLDALNTIVQNGIDLDLAFELLNALFNENEIYEHF